MNDQKKEQLQYRQKLNLQNSSTASLLSILTWKIYQNQQSGQSQLEKALGNISFLLQ